MKCDKLKAIFATPHPKMKNPCDGAIEVYGKAEVDNLIAVKDRIIRDYEDNYLPRPKPMELKCWMIGSPETGEQWVYDAEDVDRVISAKDNDIKELKKELKYYYDFENWEDI